MQRFPMTPEGEKLLREELKKRKNHDRPRISLAIKEARELGDLKENAEYHAAREEQGLNEAKIRDIEAKLSHVEVIDVTQITNNGKVIFGATITLLNMDNDETVIYKIVGEDEADVKKSKISVSSPIARSMIGKEKGDTITVSTPNGSIEFEIDEVEYI